MLAKKADKSYAIATGVIILAWGGLRRALVHL